MGRTSLPLFQINQYQNQNQNKAVSGLKGVLRLGTAFYNLLFLCAFHSPINLHYLHHSLLSVSFIMWFIMVHIPGHPFCRHVPSRFPVLSFWKEKWNPDELCQNVLNTRGIQICVTCFHHIIRLPILYLLYDFPYCLMAVSVWSKPNALIIKNLLQYLCNRIFLQTPFIIFFCHLIIRNCFSD